MTPTHVWLEAKRPDLQAEFDRLYRRVGMFCWALDGKAPPDESLPIRLAELTSTQPSVAHRTSWQKAADAVKSFVGSATSVVMKGFLDESDPVVVQRRASCAACPIRRDVDGKSYCNGCVCPQSPLWPIAELDVKLRFPVLECPRKQPGFSNGPAKAPAGPAAGRQGGAPETGPPGSP